MRSTELWCIVDSRTERRAAMASYPSESGAQRSIAEVRRNVERGRRPNLVDVVEFLEPRIDTRAADEARAMSCQQPQ